MMNHVLYNNNIIFNIILHEQITFTVSEPSVNYLDALAPFQPLQMKAISKPIDTSLNFTQAGV